MAHQRTFGNDHERVPTLSSHRARRKVIAIVVAAILAAGGCTTPGADVPSDALSSVAPGPPSVSPNPGASASPAVSPTVAPSPTPPVPAAWRDQLLATPFAEWVVDRWLVGYYGGRAVEAQVAPTSHLIASGPRIVALTPGATGTIALVDPLTGRASTVADVGPLSGSNSVAVDPTGAFAYFEDSYDEQDAGVRRVDLVTGDVEVIIGPSRLPDGHLRNLTLMSPSGRTVVSTVCDYTTCFIDVIDVASGTSRRLDSKLGGGAITDRYIFGSARPDALYGVLDLRSDTVRFLPSDLLIQVSVAEPNGEDRFLVATDQLGLGRSDIVDVDAAGANHKVVLSQAGEPTLRALTGNRPDGILLLGHTSQSASLGEVLGGTGELRVLLGDGQGLLDEVVTTEKPAP